MLKDFYTINTLQQIAANTYLCTLTLNAEHPIFKGHFPNNPVTPGVCMMQIVKNLTEQITGHQLQLTQILNVKFTALINPELHPFLQLSLSLQTQDGQVLVKSDTSYENIIALKLTNSYRIQS